MYNISAGYLFKWSRLYNIFCVILTKMVANIKILLICVLGKETKFLVTCHNCYISE